MANTFLEGDIMEYYALFYDVVDDYIARRALYRKEHLRFAQEANRRGEVLVTDHM